ncbi:McbB family protein, partial [Lactobacillus helveticus]
MKTYVVPQFVILNNSSDNAVVQNKNGISQLTDKNIIAFFNKLDELHKNKFTENFIKDFFGSSQCESI